MQKHVNLVDLVKSFPANIYLQNLASIQKRTSPVKFAHLAEKSANGSVSNLSTKVNAAMVSMPTRCGMVSMPTSNDRDVAIAARGRLLQAAAGLPDPRVAGAAVLASQAQRVAGAGATRVVRVVNVIVQLTSLVPAVAFVSGGG